jgi:hypothetical protein
MNRWRRGNADQTQVTLTCGACNANSSVYEGEVRIIAGDNSDIEVASITVARMRMHAPAPSAACSMLDHARALPRRASSGGGCRYGSRACSATT